MYKLKKLDPQGIPAALSKAERYRLLNEPREAESICRDILEVDPDGQGGSGGAVAVMILALTDQFGGGHGSSHISPDRVLALALRLDSEYDREYLSGVVCERWAKSEMSRGRDHTPGHVIFDWLARAMSHFEEAERRAPAGNEDAVLRWNSCVRILEQHREVRPRPEETGTMSDYQDV